ncbi:DUF3263 domain-containing protein [Salinibacterium sp. NK8237]|uniref:DUF3263 domain-containing protein n=1 Tax=Salinibacterium sp. NK8237 TaxID=2792038 RepID=UPI0018CC7C4C|nr:DUF3263 domain-containing protein [Salinibacterium sp. NK8237]MBH0129718.1 DUF3263 domain-containing protein [Salinibacterium sp. NK8237]
MSENEAATRPATGLSERDSAILDFEREWTRHVGAKEEAISSQFQVSSARYYQMLNAVIDSPAAVRYDPMLVSRLRRSRDNRMHTRSVRSPHHDEESTD